MSTAVPKATIKYLVNGLTASPDVLERLLEGVTDAELDARPDPDRFTLREAIAHMADWEGVWLERIERTLNEDTPFLPGYDEGQWAIDHDYAHAKLPEQLARFRSGRERIVAILSGLAPEAWTRPAKHGEWGDTTVLAMAALILGHDGYHLKQVVDFRPKAG
jgi:uncharacterized damage-inducible protein DinB